MLEVREAVEKKKERKENTTGYDVGSAFTFLALLEGLELFEAQEGLLSTVAWRRNGS